jgi:hypothetical protein
LHSTYRRRACRSLADAERLVPILAEQRFVLGAAAPESRLAERRDHLVAGHPEAKRPETLEGDQLPGAALNHAAHEHRISAGPRLPSTLYHRQRVDLPLSRWDGDLGGPFIPWTDLERLNGKLRSSRLCNGERLLLRAMKALRLERPWPELAGGWWDRVSGLALEFGQHPKRVEELARDPGRGGSVDENSLDEARIGLRLEMEGRLRRVIRDPRPDVGDLVEEDGIGQEWDVVSFRGEYFEVGDVEQTLRRKLEEQSPFSSAVKAIVNCRYLSFEQALRVSEVVYDHRWQHVTLFSSSARSAGR